MGNVQYIPRWLHRRLRLQAGTLYEKIDATAFMNEEIWNWHLKFLSVSGVVALDEEGGYYDLDDAVGGVARRLLWNVGYSQKGDISLDMLPTDAMLGSNWRQRQCYSAYNTALRFDFPTPFRLLPDAWLNVEVKYDIKVDPTGKIVGADFPAAVFNGYRYRQDGSKEPTQLAAFADHTLTLGTGLMLHNADLANNGETDMLITQMLLQSGQITNYKDDSALTIFSPDLNSFSWRVNPSTGTQWMPRAELIPVGCLSPFNRGMYDWDDQGPRAYTFPDEAVLKPKQRVGMKIRSLSTVDQVVDVCLFGMLEVR